MPWYDAHTATPVQAYSVSPYSHGRPRTSNANILYYVLIQCLRILNRRRRSSIYVMRVYPNPLRRQLAATSLCESTHCHVFAGGVDRERRVPACMQGSTDCDWGAPWPMAHEVSGLQISLDHLPRTSKFTSLNSMPCFIVEFFTS